MAIAHRVAKICSDMTLYQYEIITKPCLINENMNPVSELIYQEEHAPVSGCSEAKDEGVKQCISLKIIFIAKGRRCYLSNSVMSDFHFWTEFWVN